VNLARTQWLLVAMRGGRHSIADNASCDGSLVINPSLMTVTAV